MGRRSVLPHRGALDRVLGDFRKPYARPASWGFMASSVSDLQMRIEQRIDEAHRLGESWSDIRDDLMEVVKQVDPEKGEGPVVVRSGGDGASRFLRDVVSYVNGSIDAGLTHGDVDDVLNDVLPDVLLKVQGNQR